VRTEAYVNILTDEQDRPMVEYHWRPQKEYLRKRPHFHIKHGSTGQGTSGLRQEVRKAHFPSGRIAIEEIARFLITRCASTRVLKTGMLSSQEIFRNSNPIEVGRR
jgi:hypothetical protein